MKNLVLVVASALVLNCAAESQPTPSGSDADSCTPGVKRCAPDGTAVEMCIGGDTWAVAEECKADTRCSGPPACVAHEPTSACIEGATRCTADATSVEQCTSAGDWVLAHSCAADEQCTEAGVCLQKPSSSHCTAGDRRCANSSEAIEQCDPQGESWELQQQCDAGERCLAGACVEPTAPRDGDDWLHVEGNTIRDAQGNVVRLTGINWFGYETSMRYFHGLYSADWKESLELMAALGFNLLRVPLSVAVVREWIDDPSGGPAVNGINFSNGMNEELEGKNNLEILDMVVGHCKTLGMKVMLDMHSTAPDDYMFNLWYKPGYPFSDLVAAWEFLAERYQHDDTVIAMDLKNEPHGKAYANTNGAAIWDDSSVPNNWRLAAEQLAAAIHAVNPEVLIVVEGIETTPKVGASYGSTNERDYHHNWWGGNLRLAGQLPVRMPSGSEDKLVYSAHDYGPSVYSQPWFYGGACARIGGASGVDCFDRDSLYRDCWQPNWFYLIEQSLAPVLIGEWGGPASGDTEHYLDAFTAFLADENLHHTFWCFNPNSGDTGGIVGHDWKTVDQKKYGIVESTLWKHEGRFVGLDHARPLGSAATGMSVSEYYQSGGLPPVSQTVISAN